MADDKRFDPIDWLDRFAPDLSVERWHDGYAVSVLRKGVRLGWGRSYREAIQDAIGADDYTKAIRPLCPHCNSAVMYWFPQWDAWLCKDQRCKGMITDSAKDTKGTGNDDTRNT